MTIEDGSELGLGVLHHLAQATPAEREDAEIRGFVEHYGEQILVATYRLRTHEGLDSKHSFNVNKGDAVLNYRAEHTNKKDPPQIQWFVLHRERLPLDESHNPFNIQPELLREDLLPPMYVLRYMANAHPELNGALLSLLIEYLEEIENEVTQNTNDTEGERRAAMNIIGTIGEARYALENERPPHMISLRNFYYEGTDDGHIHISNGWEVNITIGRVEIFINNGTNTLRFDGWNTEYELTIEASRVMRAAVTAMHKEMLTFINIPEEHKLPGRRKINAPIELAEEREGQ